MMNERKENDSVRTDGVVAYHEKDGKVKTIEINYSSKDMNFVPEDQRGKSIMSERDWESVLAKEQIGDSAKRIDTRGPIEGREYTIYENGSGDRVTIVSSPWY